MAESFRALERSTTSDVSAQRTRRSPRARLCHRLPCSSSASSLKSAGVRESDRVAEGYKAGHAASGVRATQRAAADAGSLLDGLHFPHVLDGVLDGLDAASLVSASQVCGQWRRRVQSMFCQVEARMDLEHEGREEQSFSLRSRRRFSTELTHEPRNSLLLRFCEVYDEIDSWYCFRFNVMGTFEAVTLSNVKCFRSWHSTETSEGAQCALHVGSAPSLCECCRECSGLLVRWPRVSRVVFTIRGVDHCLHHWSDMGMYAPDAIDSFVVVYLVDANAPDLASHWYWFHLIVQDAWKRKATVTVVNARSLDAPHTYAALLGPCSDGTQQPPHVEGASAEDVLRRWAVEAVTDLEGHPPLDYPVRFVTLEEYRAQVGEFEYAADTNSQWLPQALGLSHGVDPGSAATVSST